MTETTVQPYFQSSGKTLGSRPSYSVPDLIVLSEESLGALTVRKLSVKEGRDLSGRAIYKDRVAIDLG